MCRAYPLLDVLANSTSQSHASSIVTSLGIGERDREEAPKYNPREELVVGIDGVPDNRLGVCMIGDIKGDPRV
jgi:hypothetical protein